MVADGAVHPLGLPVSPQVIRLYKLVSNIVFIADPAKDVNSKKSVD